MKGCYCLIIKLNNDRTVKIGKKLGKIEFKKGYYVYVGSAMNSLE
jgi:Uri superfamily endonuclease